MAPSGFRAIKGEGGLTFAEADTTAKYFAMPNSAIVAGCVDVIRGAKDIALELEAIARHPYVRGKPAADGEEVKFSGFPEGADALTKVFYLLKQHTGVNFAQYKHSTVAAAHRPADVLLQRETLEDYVKSLRSDANEVEQLFNDDSHQCYQLLSGSGVLRDSAEENPAKDHQSESGARRFSNLGAGLFNRRGGLFGGDCRLRGTVQQP